MLRKSAVDLELDKVLLHVAGHSLSRAGRDEVLRAEPVKDFDVYCRRRHLVSRVMEAIILASGKEMHAVPFPDISGLFERLARDRTARPEGPEIYDAALFIESAEVLSDIFSVLTPEEDGIETIIGRVDEKLVYMKQEIFRILESPGRVKESYPTVKALRDKSERLRAERTRFAGRYMKANSTYMNSDSPVMRDGRIVLPVGVESRSKVGGYVQGVSQTGSTLYMEPFELIDMNNAVNLANQEMELEIARLLAVLGAMVRENEDQLRILTSSVGRADFLYSFASWAMQEKCCRVIQDGGYSCNLIRARHPLLKGSCVPIDLKIEKDTRALVLTGPNAGGKTVTMKTAGLFAMLNQICGYVPASDGSSLAVFDRFFTDIGDDQSIENSLSTFSGHLKNLGSVLRNLTPDSLVILDELGSGTDPQEGAALARSILEFCTKKARLTLVTSHHGVLKQYAYSSEAVKNASMEFDEKTMEPTFRVISGIPGESHAIDTAFRMRLPKSVVFNARKYMGKEAVKISTIIRSLELREQESRKKLEDIEQLEKLALEKQKKLDDYELELRSLENSLKKEELSSFDSFIKDSRRELETLVKELREGEITREKNLRVKAHILELERQKGLKEEEIKEKERELEELETAQITDNVELKEGMEVLCGPNKREGVVVRREKDGRYQVAIGQMRFTFKESELTVPRRNKSTLHAVYDTSVIKSIMPRSSLDVRGMRLEEALDAIDNQIEACCVHGLSGFSIIHGYGNGILSTGIHSHLGTHGAVQDYFFALPEDGGQGKTYVRLRQ